MVTKTPSLPRYLWTMISETLHLSNIKCGGCAHSINTKITQIEGVSSAEINVVDGTLDTTYKSADVRENILRQLAAMGYPQVTVNNDLLMRAKSYANCLIGKSSALFAEAKNSDL